MQIVSPVLIIVGAVIGLVGGLTNNAALAIAGTVLAIVGGACHTSLVNHSSGTSPKRDWQHTRDDCQPIPASLHRRGRGASLKFMNPQIVRNCYMCRG